MSNGEKTILVVGATGQQGGSVARALQADGWRVRALVRDPASPGAKGLSAIGIETVRGDFNDPASLAVAVAGVYGVFSAQPSSGQPQYGLTDADETRFGIALADAAHRAGVAHLVHNSVAGVGPDTGVGHFSAKWDVEEHIRGLPITSTVLRPAAFMEILLLPHFGLAEGTLSFFMRPGRPMQFIAVEDIGRIVAKVFADPAAFAGAAFDIAGDSLTGAELAERLSAATGRPIAYQLFPDAVLRDAPLLARLVELVESGPAAGGADLAALRRLHPGLLTFERWLQGSGQAALAALFPDRTGTQHR